jgi:endoglucanase
MLALAVLLGVATARAEVPAHRLEALSRGINITGWFRFPASRDPAALDAWISDGALAGIAAAGFRFVRVPVTPDLAEDAGVRQALLRAVQRLHRVGLAVVLVPHPDTWHLETDPADRRRLLAFWRVVAPALRELDAGRIFPEVLNEPVFPGDPAAWAALQHDVLGVIRAMLPAATVILTGQDWGSIGGLTSLTAEPDDNVVYSVHFYEPAELTSLAAWRHDVDRAVLAGLPFPVDESCAAIATTSDAVTSGVARFYCASGWDARRIEAAFDRVHAWSAAAQVPVVLGEFGASGALHPASRLAWLRTVRETAEARGLGWALWGYDDVMGLGVPRPVPPRPRLDSTVLQALGLAARSR